VFSSLFGIFPLEEMLMTHAKKHTIKLDRDKRILFLTKDPNLIKEQLYEGKNLMMKDIDPSELLDDINTDIMTPAWVCFHHDPHEIAKRAYAGLLHHNERVFADGTLKDGNFQAIVSGHRKGTGSSRETAAQCERFSGIRLVFAASFAPIHQRNNINLGQIMGDYELLKRLQAGEEIELAEFLASLDQFSRKIVAAGGLFNFLNQHSLKKARKEQSSKPKPMTMAQKIMAKKLIEGDHDALLKQQSVIAAVDGGYSHEFTSAQVHQFLKQEYGDNYLIKNAKSFAAFEDHLIYADKVEKYTSFMPLIQDLRKQQREFIAHTGVQDYSAKNGLSPGICHEVARQELVSPGDFIQATDSHTCMGGAINAFAFGIGSTEYAALLCSGLAVVQVPSSIRFELTGKLKPFCSAKDLMLYILAHYSKKGLTLNRVMEFGGDGLKAMSIDERATLCNMATECGAKTGICEPDEKLLEWLKQQRPGVDSAKLVEGMSWPDKDCHYEGGIFSIDLTRIEPMVAHPGNPDLGIPADPMNGALVSELGDVSIDIAYGGSCTAGKYDDIEMYAEVVNECLKLGKKIPENVSFYIQYGSQKVAEYAKSRGHHQTFLAAGVIVIPPGCGACIGCGPGVSTHHQQVSISAINRNFQGRSGPGKLYLASPFTVAASAFSGKISAFKK
jgi:3-isopropylmalate/(R)-2-methylmalate dehydratase large subunit